MNNLDRLVWVDLETFGLNPQTDWIIEIGIRITDLDLETIDDLEVQVWETTKYDHRLADLEGDALNGDAGAKYVLEMHRKSGLWNAAQMNGISVDEATDRVKTFLDGYGVGKFDKPEDKEPVCGSSVQFDRNMWIAQMPGIDEIFSYRNIDVSTIKELCRRYNPRVYSLLADATQQKKLHRVLPDLDDTIGEFGFYKDNFLWEA